MIDPLKLSADIRADIESLYEPGAVPWGKMDANKAFNEYCVWHGIIGWASTLRRAIDELREAEK